MNTFTAYLIIFIGFLLTITIVGAIFGIPLMMWGSHAAKQRAMASAVAQGVEEAMKKQGKA
ncbi:MAG: hypothetical protein WC450_11990 [Candidatus Omnitrophota bacterium]|jgi:hypothetical protein